MVRTLKGITIDHSDEHNKRGGFHRAVYFEGPSAKRGNISILEKQDGTVVIRLFNLPRGTVVICPEGNYQPTGKNSEEP